MYVCVCHHVCVCARKQVASSQAHAEDFLSKIGALAKKGQVSAIVQGMLQYPGRENVQEAACRALWGLAVNADNQVKVAAEGGIRAILGAMQGHPASAGLQEAACLALCNLALNNADNQVKVKSAGAEDAVKRAMALKDATALTKDWGRKLLDRLKNV